MPVDWFLPAVLLVMLMTAVIALLDRRRKVLLVSVGLEVVFLGTIWLFYVWPGHVLRNAALAGDVNAQYELSRWYVSRALVHNREKHLYWLLKAADAKHPAAMSHLAGKYAGGDPFLGIHQDREKAIMLYRSAAAKGHHEAAMQLERISAEQAAEATRRKDFDE